MLLRHILRLHADEKGAEEGMNKLLIFAMVALPLLGLLLYFGDQIVELATGQFEEIAGEGNEVQGVPGR